MEERTKQNKSGLFLVIEGSDGSGKATQFRLLAERLKAVGYEVAVFDFPRYDQLSSHFVKSYLNGEYGPADKISPYAASLFYALDRFEAAPAIRHALAGGKIVLSNRYVGSNMAHQGSKFNNPAEQRGFFIWVDSLEFSLLNIPRPTLNIFLRVPADIAFRLIGQKPKRSYTGKSHDAHEADIDHLRRSTATYDVLQQLFPKDFTSIDCTHDGQLLDIPTISDQIWQVIQPLLPKKRPRSAGQRTFELASPDSSSQSDRSMQLAAPEITNSGSFSKIELSNISLLAVNQLLESTVELTINQLNSGRANRAHFKYYSPALPKHLQQRYQAAMAEMGKLQDELYSRIKNSKNKSIGSIEKAQLVQAVAPMATLVDIELTTSQAGLVALISRLSLSPLEESAGIVNQLKKAQLSKSSLTTAKVSTPSPDNQPELLQQTIARLAHSRLPTVLSSGSEAVQLLKYWPRNEFEILVDGIYSHTNLSRYEIAQEIDKWPYEQKRSALRAIAAQGDLPTLRQLRYQWDVICDSLVLKELFDQQLTHQLRRQPISPVYGYEVPELVETEQLEELFIQCFDLSLGLFSDLQSANRADQAPYICLQGHKLRVQFETDVFGLLEANKHRGSADYQRLLAIMTDKIMEVQPIIIDRLINSTKDSKSLSKKQPARVGASSVKKRRSGRSS